MNAMNNPGPLDGHAALVERLTLLTIPYRAVEHEAEGRTDRVSAIRGNRITQAAKAMVVLVKINKIDRQFVNVVVPGDCKLDFAAIAALFKAERVLMAPPDRAQELTGCPMGAVTPFSFHPSLALVVDPRLLEEPEIVFNAGRLDTSFFLRSDDYLRAAQPRVSRVGQSIASVHS